MINVAWIPAHPTYGSISMLRYWKLLAAARKADDPFSCSAIISGNDNERRVPAGKIEKLLTRRVIYPALVKFQTKNEITHILDHSWADLLSYVRKPSLKIVTVHDLIPLRFSGELKPSQLERYRNWVGHLKSADAIIADSAYTKQEIQCLLGIDSQVIHVVLLGVELSASAPVCINPSSHENQNNEFRIGSIGSTLERKNLAILPEALARLQTQIRRKVILVRAGAMLPYELAAKLRAILGEDGLIELGKIPDHEINDFYAGLDALVVPSLYEGFGLPVIEGMAARVPVVSSNSSSLPEVGADLALYFDPHSPEELAAVLAEVAIKGVSQEHLDMAYERAKSLSWRKCLEGIYEVYHEVMEKKQSST